MLKYVWPAIIGAIAAIIVAVVQYIVAPLVTQQQLQAVQGELKEKIAATVPNWKNFPVIRTDKDRQEKLDGQWDMCMLSTVGAVHASQACTCELVPNRRDWTVKVNLDERRAGEFCRCQASCINFPEKT